MLGISVEVGEALVGDGVGEADLVGVGVGDDSADELDGRVLDGTFAGELGGT